MTTHVDLANELEKRNSTGRLTNTIRACRDKYFHTWKSWHPNPKAECVRLLSIYPESFDLVKDIEAGVYDEQPDKHDLTRLRQSLLQTFDETKHESLYKQLGITLEQLNKMP